MEQRLKKIKSDEEKSKLKPGDREDELRRATSAGGGDVTASPADTEHWAQCGVLGLLTRQPVTGPVWVSVHGGHTSVREFLSEWVATENPHQTAHSALERGNTPLFVLLWESMLGRKQGKTRQTSGNLRNWSREAQMDTEVSHRIRTLLVTQLFPVKALRQDLVLWYTHDLQTHTRRVRLAWTSTLGKKMVRLNSVSPLLGSWRAGRCSCPKILKGERVRCENAIPHINTHHWPTALTFSSSNVWEKKNPDSPIISWSSFKGKNSQCSKRAKTIIILIKKKSNKQWYIFNLDRLKSFLILNLILYHTK